MNKKGDFTGEFRQKTKKNQKKAESEQKGDLDDEYEITDFARLLVSVCKLAPMRLDSAERQVLRILDAGLSISEYTDRVDILHSKLGADTAREMSKERPVSAFYSEKSFEYSVVHWEWEAPYPTEIG